MWSKKFIAGAIAWTFLVTLLTGCDSTGGNTPQDTITITYKQVGACNGYDTGNGIVSAGPSAAYVVFAVDTIDASQSTQDFNFDPSKLFITATGDPHIDTSLMLATDLSPLTLVATTVSAKKTTELDGFGVLVAPTAATDGASEANQTSYHLLYDPINGVSFVMTKLNDGQTSWTNTPDCHNITFSAK